MNPGLPAPKLRVEYSCWQLPFIFLNFKADMKSHLLPLSNPVYNKTIIISGLCDLDTAAANVAWNSVYNK